MIVLPSLNCNDLHYDRVKALSKVGDSVLLEHPWEKSLTVNIIAASYTDKPLVELKWKPQLS